MKVRKIKDKKSRSLLLKSGKVLKYNIKVNDCSIEIMKSKIRNSFAATWKSGKIRTQVSCCPTEFCKSNNLYSRENCSYTGTEFDV